jgi:glycerate dehydrogenase
MQQKIVILDGHTLNPGDLDWSPLQELGKVEIYDRTGPEDLIQRALGAEILLTNKTPLSATALASLPALRYIGVLATGYNVVDVAAARAKEIPVTNVPGYGTPSVAQHVWALILELCNHVGQHSAAVRVGDWTRSPDFCFTLAPLRELQGLTLGIFGYGAIGKAVAAVGHAFGMKVQVHTRTPQPEVHHVSLDELLATSDLISLHCPLTEATQGVINAERLRQMKSSALLINTSRGPLIVESDLAKALSEGVIAGAGLDVLSVEPPSSSNPLINAPNCLITPHLAWATKAARQRLLDVVVTNVVAYQAGDLQHVVN